MTKTLKFLDRALSPMLACVVGCLTAILYLNVAYAASAVGAVVDPTLPMSAAADAGWDTVTKDGPWWLLIAILHVVVRTILEKDHALLQGRRLAALTALGGVAAAVVAWHWQGAPSSGMLTAVIAGITLLVHPAPAQLAGAQLSSEVGSTRAGVILAFAIAGTAIAAGFVGGCSARARQREIAGIGAALDCEGPALGGTFISLLPLAGDAVLSWISGDGKHIDRAKMKAAMAPLTDEDAQLKCALTTALAIATTPVPQQPGAPAAAGLEIDAVAVRAEFAELRAELGWIPVATRAGVL